MNKIMTSFVGFFQILELTSWMKFDDEDQQINNAIPSEKIERINIITPKKLENIQTLK